MRAPGIYGFYAAALTLSIILSNKHSTSLLLPDMDIGADFPDLLDDISTQQPHSGSSGVSLDTQA